MRIVRVTVTLDRALWSEETVMDHCTRAAA
jgi:hypothetical protein